MNLPAAIVLLSGGLDSATVLAVAARRDGLRCHTLAFDYGQRHRHELAAAARVAAHLGAASHTVAPLDTRLFAGSALTGGPPVPKDRDEAAMAASIPVTYVPARNLVFLSIALAFAESLGARDLYIGVNAVDYSGYPDCRPEFIRAFERTANLATKAGVEAAGSAPRPASSSDGQPSARPFRVHTPLIDLPKAGIIRLGASLGVDYALTHSCYDPVDHRGETLACGRCDSCRLRAAGFAAAAVPDPTRYAPS